MADLMDDDRSDRAQVLLVAGFVLAASFVALALVLNSVIYAENLATRGEEARGSEAVNFRNDMVAGGEELIEFVNHNRTGESESVLKDDFEAALGSMSRQTAVEQSRGGQVTDTSVQAYTMGTRITQNDSSDFTNASGATEWELANGVESTRSFRVNITDSTLLDTSLAATYTVVVTDENTGDEWRMFVLDDGATSSVLEVESPSSTDTCSGGANPTIGVTAGTFDGNECEALQDIPFGTGVSAPYNITFENANTGYGNYTLVVDQRSVDQGNYNNPPSSPFAVDAIYSVKLHVSHESADLRYETDARAVPGESDE